MLRDLAAPNCSRLNTIITGTSMPGAAAAAVATTADISPMGSDLAFPILFGLLGAQVAAACAAAMARRHSGFGL